MRGWKEKEVYDAYIQEMALKRMTMPQVIANAVLFLANYCRSITGQEITVDGGWDV